MTYPIADTHTHLYFQSFDQDRDQVIKNCDQRDVKIQIQIGCDEISSIAALDLAKSHPHFYATLGLHPCDVKKCFDNDKNYRPKNHINYQNQAKNYDELFELFEELARKNTKKIVGFGETGFDLYHENSEEIFLLQKNTFRRHIQLAKNFDKPIVIHSRNAKDQLLDFLTKEYKQDFRAVLHCFCEDTDYASVMTQKYGFFLGIGGIATYPQSEKIRDAIRHTPIEFLVTETDAPFLTPQSFKKDHKRNESRFLTEVIELIAKLKQREIQECAEILFNNAKRLFNIKDN